MTTMRNTLTILGIWATLLASGRAQNQIIPAPGPAQSSGYYLQLSDDTVVDATSLTQSQASIVADATMPAYTPPSVGVGAAEPISIAHSIPTSSTPWQPAISVGGIQPAGCNDCGELWTGACSEPRGRLLHRGGVMTQCDSDCGPAACDSLGGGASCVGICGDQAACGGGCGIWAHTSSVSASFLYLRPRNADIAYAVPIDGPIAQAPANNPIQIGGVGVVDPGYETAFGASVNLALNSMTSLYGEVMVLDSSSRDQIATSAPNVLRSIVSHPSSASIATDFLSGSAHLDLDLETFDLGIRHLFVGGKVFAVNYFVGARYARLEQMFDATFLANGSETVRTDVDFDGVGPRLGFEAERQSCHSRLRLYTRASASFLAGRFQANYFQGGSFDPTVVETDWEAGRVVPVLDIELGGGWSTRNDRFRVSAGYLVSSWFNSVKTENFIRSVQNNDFIDLHDTITFDGLRVQAEFRF